MIYLLGPPQNETDTENCISCTCQFLSSRVLWQPITVLLTNASTSFLPPQIALWCPMVANSPREKSLSRHYLNLVVIFAPQICPTDLFAFLPYIAAFGFVRKFAQIPSGSNFLRTNFSSARVSLTVKAHFLHGRRYTTNISELGGWEGAGNWNEQNGGEFGKSVLQQLDWTWSMECCGWGDEWWVVGKVRSWICTSHWPDLASRMLNMALSGTFWHFLALSAHSFSSCRF